MNPMPKDNTRKVVELNPGEVRPDSYWSNIPQERSVDRGPLTAEELRQCRVFGSLVMWVALLTLIVWLMWLMVRGFQVCLY